MSLNNISVNGFSSFFRGEDSHQATRSGKYTAIIPATGATDPTLSMPAGFGLFLGTDQSGSVGIEQ